MSDSRMTKLRNTDRPFPWTLSHEAFRNEQDNLMALALAGRATAGDRNRLDDLRDEMDRRLTGTSTPVKMSLHIDGDGMVSAEPIAASDLRKGDLIINVGIVDNVQGIGVLIVADVRGTAWQLSNGRGHIARRDIVWHQSDTVVVTR